MRLPQYFIRRTALALLAFGALAACHTIRTLPPAQIEGSRPPQRLWVTLSDHSTMFVQQSELSGDTLIGMVYGEPARVPLSDAVSIRVRQAAPLRTAILAAASGVVLLGTFLYLQSRPDVGQASTCYYSIIGTIVNPCCGANDSVPC